MEPDYNDADWERLARYLAGESSARERAEVDAWLVADPSRRELLKRLEPGWRTAARPADGRPVGVDAAWARMAASVDAAERPTAIRSRFTTPALRAAAVIVVATGGFFLWRAVNRPGVDPRSVPERSFATAPAERRTITLDDSTQVVLGVASKLVVASGYGLPAREMTLEGEALFKVRHDRAKPFRVHAAGAVTEDLGTEFAVRAYGVDTVRVVVATGAVSLRQEGTDTGATVHAGEAGVFPRGGTPVVAKLADAGRLLAFSEGHLVFDNAPLSRVAEDLKRWFDVDVVFASPSLAARHVSVAFVGESLDDVLRVLALSLGAKVEQSGRTVTFTAKNAP